MNLGELMQDPFAAAARPSFADLLRTQVPQAYEQTMKSVEGALPAHADGTTVLALTFSGGPNGDGVIVAADRRATTGHTISKRDVRKVFEADAWSAVAIAGSAGPAIELARIFATELEHYEKVEGSPLSLEGKSNKLAQMVRAHLPMAMQGLVVVPLFAGYDPASSRARIYEFDPVGGRYEEQRFATNGSGGRDARGSLKARYRTDLDVDQAAAVAIEALWDAADEDAATGGPDVVRGIYPLVTVIDADGYRELPEDQVASLVEDTIAQRRA